MHSQRTTGNAARRGQCASGILDISYSNDAMYLNTRLQDTPGRTASWMPAEWDGSLLPVNNRQRGDGVLPLRRAPGAIRHLGAIDCDGHGWPCVKVERYGSAIANGVLT